MNVVKIADFIKEMVHATTLCTQIYKPYLPYLGHFFYTRKLANGTTFAGKSGMM